MTEFQVRVIDKEDNEAGIGIRIDTPNGRELTEAEKEIVRSVMNAPNGKYPSGYRWNGVIWHKEIGGNAPGNVAAAIRVDADRRALRLADALTEYQADPASFSERVRQERELAASERSLG